MKVIHFEIGVDDIERAKKFYSNIFKWKVKKWEGGPEDYWLIDTDEGTSLGDGFYIRTNNCGEDRNAGEAMNSIITIEIDNIDYGIHEVKAHGGSIISEKHDIPGVGWHIYCKDTEGNIFGLLEPSSSYGLS